MIEEERFDTRSFRASYRPRGEAGYFVEASVHDLQFQLHAMIFSKQPVAITYQPPARTVWGWGKPRSWFQRLKLRRGFGWLRRFGEVVMTGTTSTYTPQRVDISGEVLYPGAVVQKHQMMGRGVMHFDASSFHLAPEMGSVEVEYAPSDRRAVWLRRGAFEQLQQMAERKRMSVEEWIVRTQAQAVEFQERTKLQEGA